MNDGNIQSGPLIAVDIGNSAIDVGLFPAPGESELPEPICREKLPTDPEEFDGLHDWLPETPTPWYVSSVNRPATQALRRWVERSLPESPLNVLSWRDVPLAICVDAPERVGMDRLAAAVAANRVRSPRRPAIIIDAGTAFTVDVVSAAGEFLGGAILPGLHTSAAALAAATDQLPVVETSFLSKPPAVGKSTEEAIRSGLVWGTVGAIRELITRIASEVGDRPQLLFTGGDAGRLAPAIDPTARVIPDLVLAGVALTARRFEGSEQVTFHQ